MADIMKCILCDRVKKVNLVIFNQNICEECETSLIEARIGGQKYLEYKEGIKKNLEIPQEV